MERGYVVAMFPAVSRVRVQLFGGPAVSALYLDTIMPPPRAIVWVDQSANGTWIVRGAECDVRWLFQEDFNYFSSRNLLGTVDALSADTTWLYNHLGAAPFGAGTTTGTGFAYKSGILDIATGVNAGEYTNVRKEASTQAPQSGALWWQAVVANGAATTNVIVRLGLSDGTYYDFGAAGAGSRVAIFTSGTNWQLASAVGLTTTTVDTGVPMVVDKYHRFDLIYKPGAWIAGYIDGQAVGTITTNVPAAGANMVCNLGVYPVAAAQRVIRIDSCRMALIPSGLQGISL